MVCPMKNLQPFEAYSHYYDLLYREKDYVAEANSINRLLRYYSPDCRTVLEFGCGTGKHARLLAKQGYKITGVERSADMLAKASACDGIQYLEADIRFVQLEQRFDSVISLFHVMSYQISNQDVLAVFSRAAEHLLPGGLFVFDVWYTPAVLKQRPENRVRRMQDDSVEVFRVAEPIIYPNQNQVDVNYTVFIKDLATNQLTQLTERHPMRHFSLPELDLFASQTGFVRLAAEDLLTGNVPGEDTWGICLVFQKEA